MSLSFEILPSGSACGAEVRGICLARPLDESTFETLNAAFVRHGVLVFRNQTLSEPDQIRFTARFGEVDQYVLSEYRSPAHPEIMLVTNIQENGRNIGLADAGTTWHTDSSYLAIPPLATFLYAREVPVDASGRVLGDTLFASAAAAYEALSEVEQARLAGLEAVHWYHGKHAARAKLGRSDRNPPKADETQRLEPVGHPIARTHPVSGRKSLFVAEGECIAVPGMDEEEALALIAKLARHIVSECFQYRHRWRAGDLVVWDNCQVQHLAIKDYALPLRRLMHRTQVKGTTPF